MYLRYFLPFLLIFTLGCKQPLQDYNIFGYVEKITLVDQQLTVSGKLDTGAKSASLNAVDIEKIEKDNKTYLRFNVVDHDKKVSFMSEYVGNVYIKPRSGEASAPLKRPIVLMRMKIGNQEKTISVNLTNRKSFNYPLLLGRDAIIAFGGLINPKEVFLTKSFAEKNAV